MRAVALFFFVLLLSGALWGVACGSNAPTPCHEIPDGGCPLIDPDANECLDPECNSIYQCDNGSWQFLVACAPHGSLVDAAPLNSSDASDDSLADALIDAGFPLPPGAYGGGANCPPLDDTDCTLAQGLLPDQCCVGDDDIQCCQDLWVCEDAGWALYAECEDDGGVSLLPEN